MRAADVTYWVPGEDPSAWEVQLFYHAYQAGLSFHQVGDKGFHYMNIFEIVHNKGHLIPSLYRMKRRERFIENCFPMVMCSYSGCFYHWF